MNTECSVTDFGFPALSKGQTSPGGDGDGCESVLQIPLAIEGRAAKYLRPVGAEERDGRVDFDAVRKNAAAEGIDLSFIAIKYEGLTDDELDTLKARGRFAKALGAGSVLGSFGDDGEALFPEKATAVFLLGE